MPTIINSAEFSAHPSHRFPKPPLQLPMSLSYPDHYHHSQPALPHPPSTASSPFAWAPPPLTANPQSSMVEQHQKGNVPYYPNHLSFSSPSSSSLANSMLPPQSASPFAYPPPPLHMYPQQAAYPPQGAPGPASQSTLYGFTEYPQQSYHQQPSNILPGRQSGRPDGLGDHHSPDLSDEPQHVLQSSAPTPYPVSSAFSQTVPTQVGSRYVVHQGYPPMPDGTLPIAQRAEPIEWKSESDRIDLDGPTIPVIKTAPTDRPFRCDQCAQSFNRNHDLKRHKQIHLTVKPFPCDKCEKAFSRKDALRRHWLVKGCRVNAPRQAISDPGDLNGPDAEHSFLSQSGASISHASKHRRLSKDSKGKEKTSPDSKGFRRMESQRRDGSSVSSKSSLADSSGKKEDHFDEQSVSEGFSDHQAAYGYRTHPYRHSNMSPSPRHPQSTPLLRTNQPYPRLPSPQPIPISSSSSYPSTSYLSVQPPSMSMPRASSFTDLAYVPTSEYVNRSAPTNQTGQVASGPSSSYPPPYPLPYTGSSSQTHSAEQESSYHEHQPHHQSYNQSVDHSTTGYHPSSFGEPPSVIQTARSGPWNASSVSSSSVGLTGQNDQSKRSQMFHSPAHERAGEGANSQGSTPTSSHVSRPFDRSDGRFVRVDDDRQEGYPVQAYPASSSLSSSDNHHLQHQQHQQSSLGLESQQHPLHQYKHSQPPGQYHPQHIHPSSHTEPSIHVQHHHQGSDQVEPAGSYSLHSLGRPAHVLQHPMSSNLHSNRA